MKGLNEMDIKKNSPHRVAFVACRENCGNCQYGCLGCDICVEACGNHAISTSGGVAKVRIEACVGCGMCADVCPQHIIHLRPLDSTINVQCSNLDAGKTARQVCIYSCIGCGACEKICPAGAIHVVDHCARIQQKYCLSCGMCVMKCPRDVIRDLRGVLSEF